MKKVFLVFLFSFMMVLGIYADDSLQQFEGFNLVGYTDDGEKAWDLNSETADVDGAIIKLTNMEANAYEQERLNLTAQEGFIDKISGHIHLERDVVITSEEGDQLITDSLDWERDNDLVKTEDQVVLTRGSMQATGLGMKAHPGLKNAELKEDVTVRVNIEPEKPKGQFVTITCDGPMEVDQNKQMAVFHNNVVAVQEVEGRELKADKMEVFFDMESNQIKKLICTGNVSVIQGENKSYSDKMVYTAENQQLTLSGRPKLVFYTEEGEDSGPFGN